MSKIKETFVLEVGQTKSKCPIGETVANEYLTRGRIPVLSCEGACIRGEIARVAANLVAKEDPYSRACHGELFAVPDSAMAKWVKPRLVQFDALSHYNKYTDRFDIDSVPEEEREQVARSVAEWVLASLEQDTAPWLPYSDRREAVHGARSQR